MHDRRDRPGRSRFGPIGRILSTLSAAAIFVGCISGPTIRHEFSMAPGRGHHPDIQKALLVPLNETLPRPTGLDQADALIEALTIRYLTAQQLDVEAINQREYRRAIRLAVRQSRTEALSGESGTASEAIEFGKLVPILLSELESDAQIVILPNLVIRDAEYSGGQTLRWDGVRRRERGAANMRMTGVIGAASMATRIFDADGNELFSSFGGLDLIFELNRSEKRYDLREDLLADEDNLAEGICVSFHPYFGEQDDC